VDRRSGNWTQYSNPGRSRLAYLAAQSGRATVLWDLDPQGAATYTLQCEPADRIAARKLVRGKQELHDVIAPTA
jgi:cellulose biosynthesis protein BcsQ